MYLVQNEFLSNINLQQGLFCKKQNIDLQHRFFLLRNKTYIFINQN